jgi:hypothetical protein
MSRRQPIELLGAADFQPTLPPALPDALLAAFHAEGLVSIRVSSVDAESRDFLSAWFIAPEGGELVAGLVDRSRADCPTAMATIVHLSDAPADDVVMRQLDALRWVFAWRSSETRVAVAEATYQFPTARPTPADARRIREICEVVVPTAAGEAFGDARPAGTAMEPIVVPVSADPGPESLPLHAPMPSSLHLHAPMPSLVQRAAERPRRRPGADDLPPRADRDGGSAVAEPAPQLSVNLVLMLLALYVLVVGTMMMVDRHASASHAEQLAQQQRTDAGMARQVAQSMATGDYGEVQAVLDALVAARPDLITVVANGRGRVVAMAGESHGARIGDPVPLDVAETARRLPLGPDASHGQLVVWSASDVGAQPGHGGLTAWMVVAASLCALAIAAVASRARRGPRGLKSAQPGTS